MYLFMEIWFRDLDLEAGVSGISLFDEKVVDIQVPSH